MEACEDESLKAQENTLQGTNSSSLSVSSVTNTPETLSKRQRKKLLKRQKWLDTREERKKRDRQKQKVRLEAKRTAGEICGNVLRKRLKGSTMANSSCKQRVTIDMSFDDLMIEKHLAQCVKQVSRCYSANRRATDPMQLYVTSFEGKCLELMARQNGYMNWDVHFKSEKYLDLFNKEELVYLTSESNNVITTLDESKIYVIGGLVDHNVHKGLCHSLAKYNGIQHARLPISEFIEMKTRKVLTVDQVFRILLGVSQGRTWKESFLDVIPARKGAMGKDDPDEDAPINQDEDAPINQDDPDEDAPINQDDPDEDAPINQDDPDEDAPINQKCFSGESNLEKKDDNAQESNSKNNAQENNSKNITDDSSCDQNSDEDRCTIVNNTSDKNIVSDDSANLEGLS